MTVKPVLPDAIRGLYAITPEEPDTQRLLSLVSRAIEGGIDVLQYRSKLADPVLRRAQATGLKSLCDAAGIPFIVNDDVALALEVDASGVHVGRDDGEPAEVRARIGPARLLGVSCYDSLERALALRGIAEHVAFGSVFASGTKPAAVRAPLALFGRARREGLRTVAIGGIDAGNAAQVLAAGADAIAVIGDLFGGDDPRAAAERLARVVRQARAQGAVRSRS
jgi:thiamine-phosphate pyrophosphorylase